MFSRVLKLPEMMVLLIVIAHGVLFVSAIFLCARKPNSTKTKQYAEGMVNPNSLSSRKSVRGSDSKHSSSKSLEKKKKPKKHQKLETKPAQKEEMKMLLENCETVPSKLNKEGRRGADAFVTAASEEATTSSPPPKEKQRKRKPVAAAVLQKPKIERVRRPSRITDFGERDGVMGMQQVDIEVTQQSGYNAVQDEDTDLRTPLFIKGDYGMNRKQPPTQATSQVPRPTAEQQPKIVATSDNEKESSGDVESGEKMVPPVVQTMSLTQAAIRKRPENRVRGGGTRRARRAKENVGRMASHGGAKRRCKRRSRQ